MIEKNKQLDEITYTYFRRGVCDYFTELNDSDPNSNEMTLISLLDSLKTKEGAYNKYNQGSGGGGGNSNDENESDNGNKRGTKRCSYCGRNGHLAFECWDKHDDYCNECDR